MYLFETVEGAKTYGAYADLPRVITDNLNPKLELRPYQKEAFQNFVTYFENPKLRFRPSQTLFHMATGSGKTLIMAGLIIYLYKQGYRRFLFFVDSSNIVQKTKENFMNAASAKYFFRDPIVVDGRRVPVKEVTNFQAVDEDAINICFITIQGLNDALWNYRENSLFIDELTSGKLVLISDEAHHLNAMTKKGVARKEEDNSHTWETTVKMIFEGSPDNVLLEFTATLDRENPFIRNKYEKHIIYNYTLAEFSRDGYSKEIMTLRSDLAPMDRALQALMLSQYRLKVFQEHHLDIKPVILFKSRLIKESHTFMAEFADRLAHLTGSDLQRIQTANPDSDVMNKAYSYFRAHGLDFNELAAELADDFSPEHCISANDDKDTEKNQLLLNSLEDKGNPYRAVFEVEKLDEGWDVLNLFDIVRLYETRQSSGSRISKATIQEAQLIGRGARYCPFQLDAEQPKYQRKFDKDVDNEMRIGETLYYHCYNEHRYITELHNALKEIGLYNDPESQQLTLKESFKKDIFFKSGKIYINHREPVDRSHVIGISPQVRKKFYIFHIATGQSGVDRLMADDYEDVQRRGELERSDFTIGELAEINYALVYKAIARRPSLRFTRLQECFPNLKSTRQFIMDSHYLKDIQITIKSRYSKEELTMSLLFMAVNRFMEKIAAEVDKVDVHAYRGTTEFYEENISKVFHDKRVVYTKKAEGGIGYGQNDSSVNDEYRFDLRTEDWYAYMEDWGTDEEKAFVGYFREFVPKLRQKYDKVYLVRNEREFHLYSFDEGARFEPDFVIFLQKKGTVGYDQLQIFVEPKGTQLVEKDAWKEKFLLQMRGKAIPVKKLRDDNHFTIWGLHFFNRQVRTSEFHDDFLQLL